MDKVATALTVAGVAGVGYLGYDYIASKSQAGAAGVPLVTRGVDAVRNRLPASLGGSTASLVATPYPVVIQAGQWGQGAPGNVNITGVMDMAEEICGVGSGQIVGALASVESTNGSLRSRCYNCNLFGMHISQSQIADNRSYFISNNEPFIDFLTGAPSQAEGFKACMNYFMDWMNRYAPAAIPLMRSGNFEAFQASWATAWGASPYRSQIVNGSVPRSLLRARYERLVSARLA